MSRNIAKALALLRGHPIEASGGAAILCLLAKAVMTGSFLITGHVLYASMLGSLAALVAGLVFLRRQGVGKERVFLSLAAVASGIWLYEVFYHYAFADTINVDNVLADLFYLNINTTGSAFPLLWALMMISLPLAGCRHMRINTPFILVVAAGVVVFYLWYQVGYPQWFAPCWWPQTQPSIDLIPMELRNTDSSTIVYWGYIFNSLSKILVTAPAMLFHRGRRRT